MRETGKFRPFDNSGGGSIDLDGDVLAATTTRCGPLGTSNCRVRFFRGTGPSFSLETEFDLGSQSSSPIVQIDGDLAVVGGDRGPDARVQVFWRGTEGWARTDELRPPIESDRSFGERVQISDQWVAISARQPNDDAVVYMFQRQGRTLVDRYRLESSFPLLNGTLTGLSLSGDVLAQAEYDRFAGGERLGRVAIYENGDRGWSEATAISYRDSTQQQSFMSLAASDNRIVVSGQVSIEKTSSGTWSEAQVLDFPNGPFGPSALDEGVLAVGIPSEDKVAVFIRQ